MYDIKLKVQFVTIASRLCLICVLSTDFHRAISKNYHNFMVLRMVLRIITQLVLSLLLISLLLLLCNCYVMTDIKCAKKKYIFKITLKLQNSIL